MEKLELLKKALALQDIELTEWKLETVVLTYDKINLVGEHFSLRDAIEIKKKVDNNFSDEDFKNQITSAC